MRLRVRKLVGGGAVIEVWPDELLAVRSYCRLAKETGVSRTTPRRLKKGRAAGINFETLEKVCAARGRATC
jgi:DNA-binding Xre family transcriptional regulator